MTVANVKASELSPEIRLWVQSLLHRELAADEQVSVAVQPAIAEIDAADRDWLEGLQALASEDEVPTLPADFSRADVYSDGRG